MSRGASDGGTVGKALEVLDRVAAFGRPVRFGDLLDDSPYPKATLYRFLQTLTRERMLSYDPDRQTYAPGIRLVRLAHDAWRQASLAPLARDHIDALSAEIGETVHLAQLDNGQVLYVDKRNAHDPLEMFSQAGKVGPAHCTGVGKAMLAFLPPDQADVALEHQSYHSFTPRTLTTANALRRELATIRTRGYAFDDEEHEPGIICIAMPILSESGRVMGALSVTTSTMRNTIRGLEKLAPKLRRTAQAISTSAETWTFPDGTRPQEAKGAA